MPRRAFRLAYDGRPFHGFQRQPDLPTVEAALFDACRALDLGGAPAASGDGPTRDPPPGYAAAGRTDAGVSALAQTVTLDCPDWCTPAALNGELPASVWAWASTPVAAGFHPREPAGRAYLYHLYAPSDTVADDRVGAALRRLSGRHDFRNLAAVESGTVRDLSCAAVRDGDFLVLWLRAGGFVHELCRRVASLVRAVGAGEREPADVGRLLGPDPVDGPAGVPPATPEPLVLVDVRYPEIAFDVDTNAASRARAAFEARRADRRGAARVAGTVADCLPAGGAPDR
ncbi:MAG: tRNA pseudouridine(38-40) synthase TruA [Halobacteriaceae archaeon]